MELHILQREIQGLQWTMIAVRSEKDFQQKIFTLQKLCSKLHKLTEWTANTIIELEEQHKKVRNPKLQFLHKAMLRHEHMTGQDFQKTKADLYKKYGITSRSELNDAQLDEAIHYFVTIV